MQLKNKNIRRKFTPRKVVHFLKNKLTKQVKRYIIIDIYFPFTEIYNSKKNYILKKIIGNYICVNLLQDNIGFNSF